MKEWVLIITMRITSTSGELNDIQMETVDGFTSDKRCEEAGKAISKKIIFEAAKHIKEQRMNANNENKPSIYFICEELIK